MQIKLKNKIKKFVRMTYKKRAMRIEKHKSDSGCLSKLPVVGLQSTVWRRCVGCETMISTVVLIVQRAGCQVAIPTYCGDGAGNNGTSASGQGLWKLL
jgi:hypothetical protein